MHAHDRTLVQALGAESDHKTPEHEAACLYLQHRAEDVILSFITKQSRGTEEYRKENFHFRSNECANCRYVVQEDVEIPFTKTFESLSDIMTELEHPITKGEGKYKTHIGFIDVVIDFEATYKITYDNVLVNCDRVCRRSINNNTALEVDPWTERPPLPPSLDTVAGPRVILYDESHSRKNFTTPHQKESRMHTLLGSLLIEVKTKKPALGDLIRQIKLYREYHHKDYAVRKQWISANTFQLSEPEVCALKNEGITPIFIGEGYKQFITGNHSKDVKTF